jgi:hypothetical protein
MPYAWNTFFAPPTWAHIAPNVTSIEKRGGGGCLAGVGRRRRQQGKTAKGEEGEATPVLFLKHSHATLVACV